MALEYFWSTVLFGFAVWIFTTPHSMDDDDAPIPLVFALICGSLWLSWSSTGAWLIYFLDLLLPQKGTIIHLVTVWIGCIALLLVAVSLLLEGVLWLRHGRSTQTDAGHPLGRDTE